MAQESKSTFKHIKESIFRRPVHPGTERERTWAAFENLILHIHPKHVPEPTLQFKLTWGLGGMSLVLIMLLALTGILLLFVYEPSPDRAYLSILTLQKDVLFGELVRNVHHWSGNILVIVVFLHLLRVFFTGAFHGPRQFNWMIGLTLFLCILLSNFTGYLLPWDQLAFWAITICTSMLEYIPLVGPWLQNVIRGGPDIGPATLLIFFTLHATVVPICLVILLPFHFWRIRKAGGVVIPRADDGDHDETPQFVPTIPNLILKEAVVGLCLIAVVLMYSIIINAPLEAPANAGLSPNPAKAPWYFLGIQELLLHFHPLFAAVIVPAVCIVLLFLLPYLKHDVQIPGVWFISQKGREMGKVSAISALITVPFMIMADEFIIDLTSWLPGLPPEISNGLIPVSLISAALFFFYRKMNKSYAATKTETLQALMIFLAVSFALLTVTGIWFRGEGMGLALPWSVGVME